jgi:hypothetical protein
MAGLDVGAMHAHQGVLPGDGIIVMPIEAAKTRD